MKTAIVGSTGFAPIRAIARLIRENPGEIITRHTKSWGVDQAVVEMLQEFGMPGQTYEVTEKGAGARADVFFRDLMLVADADKIIAIFAPNRVMEGGTAHIVNKALDERKEVEAYTVDDEGELVLVGGNNPRDDSI